MKVILSRKGFDNGNAKMPSPIMPDGTLLSLPIPFSKDTEKFSKLKYGKKTYLEIIRELKPRTKIKDGISLPTTEVNKLYSIMAEYWNEYVRTNEDKVYDKYAKSWDRYKSALTKLERIYNVKGGDDCHLDPDLRKEARQREKGWLPLFGQSGRAQTILYNNGVSIGDLFLFFGWFRKIQENSNGKFVYREDEPNIHIIYGYLQIGKIFSMNDYTPSDIPKWMQYHSHADKMVSGSIYAASNKLSFAPSFTGGGTFKFHKDLVLTKEGCLRSTWDLPDFFRNIKTAYLTPEKDYFQSAPRGQEFVIEENKNVSTWAKRLVKRCL